MISRSGYLNQLVVHREHKIIKVVTGVRRCGKSTLLEQYRDYLKASGVSEDQIISINLEDLAYESLLQYRELYQYVHERLCKDRFTYVFIDEVQRCTSFEKAVDSLFIQDQVDVYITGSNAHMLSSELATLLSGRYITVDMLPLSFSEYKQAAMTSNQSLSACFNDYLRWGSFPYTALLEKNTTTISPYLEGIYNTILLKDVATRVGISDVALLESIVKTIASGIGSPISTKRIADTLVSGGRKISVNTVDNYVRALTDSYIFYRVDRYDIKGRQFLKTLGKYYMVDTGIRQMLVRQSAADLGHLIENEVFLELKRRGYQVNIGKLDEVEVDFVASGPDGILYVQVAASVLDENTLKRELSSLQRIPDNYPKILLTLDEIGHGADHNGIKQFYLLHWLLDDD